MAQSKMELTVPIGQTEWVQKVGLLGPKKKLYTGWVDMGDGSMVQYQKGRKTGQTRQATPGTPGGIGGGTSTDAGASANKPLPAGVQRASSQFLANLSQLEASGRRQSAARRSNFATSVIGAGSTAADIYGGRAPAIFGQALTGAQRAERRTASAQALSQADQEKALRDAYAAALGEEYSSLAQRGIDDARRRAENISITNRVGV